MINNLLTKLVNLELANLKIKIFIINLGFLGPILCHKPDQNYNFPDLKDYKSAFVLPKVCLNNSINCYYFIGRKAAKKHKGVWTLIGGKREQADLSVIDTLKREFKEETLGAFDIKFIDKSLKANFTTNLKISKDQKAVLIAELDQKSLFKSAKLFYKKTKKLILNKKFEDLELDKLALIKVFNLKNNKNLNNYNNSINNNNINHKNYLSLKLKAQVIEPDGKLKPETITLRSSAKRLLNEI